MEPRAFPEIEYVPGSFAGPFSRRHAERVAKMAELAIPETFLQYCEKYNGGVPVDNVIDFDGEASAVERFLCFVEDYKTNAEDGLFDVGVVWSQIEDRLNEHLLPFAALFAGDFLCFDTSSETGEGVVFWDHERSGEDDPVTRPVADTFEGFLRLLHPPN